jgi:hypothetical protein
MSDLLLFLLVIAILKAREYYYVHYRTRYIFTESNIQINTYSEIVTIDYRDITFIQRSQFFNIESIYYYVKYNIYYLDEEKIEQSVYIIVSSSKVKRQMWNNFIANLHLVNPNVKIDELALW